MQKKLMNLGSWCWYYYREWSEGKQTKSFLLSFSLAFQSSLNATFTFVRALPIFPSWENIFYFFNAVVAIWFFGLVFKGYYAMKEANFNLNPSCLQDMLSDSIWQINKLEVNRLVKRLLCIILYCVGVQKRVHVFQRFIHLTCVCCF